MKKETKRWNRKKMESFYSRLLLEPCDDDKTFSHFRPDQKLEKIVYLMNRFDLLRTHAEMLSTFVDMKEDENVELFKKYFDEPEENVGRMIAWLTQLLEWSSKCIDDKQGKREPRFYDSWLEPNEGKWVVLDDVFLPLGVFECRDVPEGLRKPIMAFQVSHRSYAEESVREVKQ